MVNGENTAARHSGAQACEAASVEGLSAVDCAHASVAQPAPALPSAAAPQEAGQSAFVPQPGAAPSSAEQPAPIPPQPAAPPLAAGMPLRAAWQSVQKTLARAHIEDAPFDAAQLVQHATGLAHRLHPDAPLTPEQAAALHALTQRRAAREPLQYLLGAWDFLDFTLRVGKGVLIPRADTEIVCETAIAAAREAAARLDRPHVVDLCAGSGAIAIGVARAVPPADVTAVELSDDAFGYLCENAAALAPQLTLVKADVFTWQNTLPAAGIDVLVSNPPYIAADEMRALAPELSFEPRMALEATENGLVFYRHIARAYRRALRPGGALVLEIGSAQADAVCALLQENCYTEVAVLQDAANLPRCVTARAPEELH